MSSETWPKGLPCLRIWRAARIADERQGVARFLEARSGISSGQTYTSAIRQKVMTIRLLEVFGTLAI